MNDDTTAHEPATEVVSPMTQPAPELAWSQDDDTNDDHQGHQPWPRVLVMTLVAIVALIGLAVIGLGTEYFRDRPRNRLCINRSSCRPAHRRIAASKRACQHRRLWPLRHRHRRPPLPRCCRAPISSSSRHSTTWEIRYPDKAYAISHAHATCDFVTSHSGQSAAD